MKTTSAHGFILRLPQSWTPSPQEFKTLQFRVNTHWRNKLKFI